MELFAPDATVDALQRALRRPPAGGRAAVLGQLAWHLRQRDTRRAEQLAAEAADLAGGDAGLQARSALTRAECALLLMRLDDCRRLAGEALAGFAARGDPLGTGDAHLTLARLALAVGDRQAEQTDCAAALGAYREAKDRTREGHAIAMGYMARGLADPGAIAADIARLRAEGVAPAVDCHLTHIEAVLEFQRGRFAEAIALFSRVADVGRRFGMHDLVLSAEFSIAGCLSNLGDRAQSAAMCERVLARAREFGWPRSVGGALSHLGRLLMQTGEAGRAVEVLEESARVLAPLSRSRHFAIVQYYLGDAHLALGHAERALEALRTAEAIQRDLGFMPEVACVLAIQAQALSRLGRVDEALARANEALEIARRTKSSLWEAEALRSLAEIHVAHPSADGARSPASALEFLRRAVAVVDSMGGHHEKSQVLAEISRVQEKAGDLAAALEAERAARAEQSREAHREAANQVLAAQVRHDTERARLEAEHQRTVAAAEAARSQALQASLETLEELRLVGQDITAHLDTAGMVAALHRHLRRLADVTFIGVYVFDPSGGTLKRHAVEHDTVLPVRQIHLNDAGSYAARAVREGREIHVEAGGDEPLLPPIPGTEATASLWFAPLLVAERPVGVLTVQTTTPRAYGEREKLIFRAVCGYAAVALANARIHGELSEQHRLLAETEAEMRRLATTDALTGLANRRHFLARAEAELARAKRYGGPVGFAMADIDRFKAINDTHGHPAGDRVLATVARALARQQRPNDLVGRLGGEEFALLLPGATLEAMTAVAERLRGEVETLRLDWNGHPIPVTVSFGCAGLEEGTSDVGDPAATLQALVQEADKALYAAKNAGRNRVVAADGGPGLAVGAPA